LTTMIAPKLLMRSGFVISFIGHVAVLTLGLIFGGANPFAAAPADAIAVDIVTPDEVREVPSAPSQPAEMTAARESPAPSAPATQTPATLPQPPSQPPPRPDVERSAQPGRPQSQPLESVGLSQSPAPLAEAQEPNVSDMFGLPLALPDGRLGGGFDAQAIDKADIANDDIAAFHNRLKTCSTRPAGVNTADDVKAVLRIFLKPDGTLAAPPQPIRIEGVSRGGGALYQSIVAALRKCQPYNMLPPDKYSEWKVLDLSFTPQDFAGG
jgi:hypothetical protein